MPIYEYECNHCGHHVEALQKFSDPPIVECEACHCNEMKRLISQSTFHLKGSGWYVTDYASKSGSNHHSRGNDKVSGEGKGGDTQKSKTETTATADKAKTKGASAASNKKE